MALKMTVDSLTEVSEAQRSLYSEKDGKFHLELENYEDPVGLKSALQKEREAARTASAHAKAWEKLGKTPEEISTLLEAQRKADEDKLNKAGEWDKLRAQMNEQHAAELATSNAKLTAKDKAIERHLIDAEATSAISELKGIPLLLLPHVKASVKVIEENDELFVRVMDKTGNPRVNSKGEFLTIKDLVSEMKQSDVFGRAFEASGTTGSGAQQHGKGGVGKADLSKLPPTERMTAARLQRVS